ncbi:MAG TPA: ABC transporter ATP-binding protein, partial [Tepidisphaeraceae bacterium]|nr:ABC transporter ATP-binding protein [Tepidisphaeraceae bacterium]
MSEPADESQPTANKRKGHFFRAVGYLRPYRKWVAISILCALMTGAFTAGGLGAMLPLLNVLVQGTSVPTYLDSLVVEREMRVTLTSEAGGFRVVRYRDSTVDQPFSPGTMLTPDDLQRLSAERLPDAPVWLRALRRIGGWLPVHPVGAIASIFAFFLGIALLGSVTRFFQEYLSDTCAVASINDIRRQLYDHVLHLPVGYFAKHGTGDVTARLVTDAQGLQDGFKTVLGKAIQEPINAVFALTLAMLIDWRLTLFVIVVAPAMVAAVKHCGTRVRRAARAALQKNALMFGQIESTLSGIRVVKSAAAEPHERRKYRNILENLKREQFRMSRYEAWSTPALELLGLIAVGGVLIVASYFVLVQHTLQAPQFMVIMFALVVIGESLRRLSKLNNVLQRSNAAAARIFEVLDRARENDPEETPRSPTPPAGPSSPHQLAFRSVLRFDNVTFRYPGAPTPSLENVQLEIPKGTSVAVVGRNGSG